MGGAIRWNQQGLGGQTHGACLTCGALLYVRAVEVRNEHSRIQPGDAPLHGLKCVTLDIDRQCPANPPFDNGLVAQFLTRFKAILHLTLTPVAPSLRGVLALLIDERILTNIACFHER